MRETEVFVCGGGPAGLAAAIAARVQGLSASVADCFQPPIEKACGEGLMPDALDALTQLGVTLEGCGTGVFSGIRFIEGERRVESRFPAGMGRGIRRVHLHDALHRRALEVGVDFLWGAQVLRAEPTPGGTGFVLQAGEKQVRARWLVGADGLHSRVRRWAGLDAGHCHSRRVGIRRHYRIQPWSEFVEVYWGRRGQIYVTPLGRDEICVASVARGRGEPVERSLAAFPALESRLRHAQCVSAARGASTLGQAYRRVTAGRVALLGDASGSVDAVTGAGLGLAFQQAAALGRALRAGNLGFYEQAHREIRRRSAFMSRAMLLLDRFPRLRHVSLASFERNPWLFEQMLSLHVGAVPRLWSSGGAPKPGGIGDV